MMSGSGYAEYLARYEQLAGGRKKLDPDQFERLSKEHDRLIRRMDPADIQLDEWKRLEELRFLLILTGDEEE